MSRNPASHTHAWRRLSHQVITEEPTCWLQLPRCTGKSTTADHIKPIHTHPHLQFHRNNLHGACRNCNDDRGTWPADQLDKLRTILQAKHDTTQHNETNPSTNTHHLTSTNAETGANQRIPVFFGGQTGRGRGRRLTLPTELSKNVQGLTSGDGSGHDCLGA